MYRRGDWKAHGMGLLVFFIHEAQGLEAFTGEIFKP